jgi:hypothetical protein
VLQALNRGYAGKKAAGRMVILFAVLREYCGRWRCQPCCHLRAARLLTGDCGCCRGDKVGCLLHRATK